MTKERTQEHDAIQERVKARFKEQTERHARAALDPRKNPTPSIRKSMLLDSIGSVIEAASWPGYEGEEAFCLSLIKSMLKAPRDV